MSQTRTVEIFTAGCPICDQTVDMVRRIACDSCDIDVLNLSDEAVARRAAALGIRSVPAVVIDGELAGCCDGRGVSEEALLDAGIGQPL
ncbi:MAG: thioredoxin family protein [Rhodothermales bacterium]